MVTVKYQDQEATLPLLVVEDSGPSCIVWKELSAQNPT